VAAPPALAPGIWFLQEQHLLLQLLDLLARSSTSSAKAGDRPGKATAKQQGRGPPPSEAM
jgi:hypothetical protein